MTDRRPAPELGGASEALVHERASATPSAQAHAHSHLHGRPGAPAKEVAPPPRPGDTSLRALEEWFLEAVTSPCEGDALGADARQVLTQGPKLDASARLEIYRYAYRARLVECLADDYPALQFALGAEAFEALCHEYIQLHPSSAPSLNFFGRRMAHFCRSEAAEPFALRRFAADLAALEWALVEVLHARVADALSPTVLGAIPTERWPAARLPPSAAVRVVRADYPVNAFFQAFKSGEEPQVPGEGASITAVYRTDMTLWRMALTPAMAALLEGLFRGETLGEALERLLPDETRLLPDETRLLPDETRLLPDETRLLPDETSLEQTEQTERAREHPLSEAEAAEAERSVMVWFREWVAAGFFARVELDG